MWQEMAGSKVDVASATIQMARDIIVIRLCYMLGVWSEVPPKAVLPELPAGVLPVSRSRPVRRALEHPDSHGSGAGGEDPHEDHREGHREDRNPPAQQEQHHEEEAMPEAAAPEHHAEDRLHDAAFDIEAEEQQDQHQDQQQEQPQHEETGNGNNEADPDARLAELAEEAEQL